MTHSIEQSIKERIKALAKTREASFPELWHNLILERFLVRLAQSEYRENFILKGGALLARYLPLGRETKDLDFLVHHLSNTQKVLKNSVQAILSIDLKDSFNFQLLEILSLEHDHMPYPGSRIRLLVKFGKTKTYLDIDLGFGDIIEPIDQSILLTSNTKGPFFESKISVRCYPKEFIFAEKLETILFRGGTNSRMKDFHDLHSLVTSSHELDPKQTEKAIKMVFKHREMPLDRLPLSFIEKDQIQLDNMWKLYLRRIKISPSTKSLPEDQKILIDTINSWLSQKTNLCPLNFSNKF